MMNQYRHATSADELVIILRRQQQESWKHGERLLIEAILATSESAPPSEESLLELILSEFQLRAEFGDMASPDEYYRRFPHLRVRLERLFALRAALENTHSEQAVDRETNSELPPIRGTPSQATQVPPHSTDPVDLKLWLDSILEPSPEPGDLGLFGDYRVQGILGHGGMGIVLKAWEQSLDRAIALKLILPKATGQADAKARFLREAKAAAAVLHHRIVPIFAVGEVNRTPFLAMPLLNGQSLGALLKKHPSLSVPDAVRYARETAEGLAVAHGRGMTHRDIKPDNLWLEQTTDGSHVRILDFGLARGGSAQAITHDGAAVGTPHYMAPEQAAGHKPDPRADLFSLGCVLYEMLAGVKPFNGTTLYSVLTAIANYHPPPLHTLDPSIPSNLSNLVSQLLEKDAQKRFPSAEQLVSVLRPFESGVDHYATTIVKTPPSRPTKFPAKRLGMAVAMAVLVLIGLSYRFWPGKAQPAVSTPQKDAADVIPVQPTASTATDAVAIPVPMQPEEIRVKKFQINHIEKIGADKGHFKGIFGQNTFGAHVGDQVTLNVEFNRPAYAYLVAFRPDGVMELIYPNLESDLPELRQRIQYPDANNLGNHYGLSEGAGLWVFAVAASDQPLPAFQEWAESKPDSWVPAQVAPGAILDYDGYFMETLTKNSTSGATRSKNEKALGVSSHLWKALQYVKHRSHATFTAGQGIVVEN